MNPGHASGGGRDGEIGVKLPCGLPALHCNSGGPFKGRVLLAQSCLTRYDPTDFSPPGKNTVVGCHSLLQGIFLTQGSNLGLLPYRQILYHLSHQGSPFKGRSLLKTVRRMKPGKCGDSL